MNNLAWNVQHLRMAIVGLCVDWVKLNKINALWNKLENEQDRDIVMHMQIKDRNTTSGQISDLPAGRAANTVTAADTASADFHNQRDQHRAQGGLLGGSMSDRRRRLLWMLEEIEREEQEYAIQRRNTALGGGMRPWVGAAVPELDNNKMNKPNRAIAQKTIGNYKRVSSLNAEQSYKASAVKSLFSVEEDL